MLKRSTLQKALAKMGYSSAMMKVYQDIGGKVQPTYMSCLIDDATKYIIHAQFYGDMEQTIVEDTLKKGIQKYGTPRRIYFDNYPRSK